MLKELSAEFWLLHGYEQQSSERKSCACFGQPSIPDPPYM